MHLVEWETFRGLTFSAPNLRTKNSLNNWEEAICTGIDKNTWRVAFVGKPVQEALSSLVMLTSDFRFIRSLTNQLWLRCLSLPLWPGVSPQSKHKGATLKPNSMDNRFRALSTKGATRDLSNYRNAGHLLMLPACRVRIKGTCGNSFSIVAL